jgi:hypothetical protein
MAYYRWGFAGRRSSLQGECRRAGTGRGIGQDQKRDPRASTRVLYEGLLCLKRSGTLKPRSRMCVGEITMSGDGGFEWVLSGQPVERSRRWSGRERGKAGAARRGDCLLRCASWCSGSESGSRKSRAKQSC